MHHVAGAGYRSGNRQGCLRGTRKDILWQIDSWLTDERDQRLFWLNGLAGTGKSTIAQTFAETSFSDGKLGASFFCSRDFEDRSNIQNIFPTLAFQLAYRYPQFRKELLPVLKSNPEVGRDSLCSQLETLIIGPFKATHISTLIIIDALDECKDNEPASAILSVLSRYIDQIPKVKFFITGRPEPRVRTGFRLELLRPITEVLKLHEVERSSVDDDIKLFFKARLGDIAKTRSDCDFTEDWPSSYDIDVLCKKAAGLFIYASTVVKFVASEYDLPTERLTIIISLRHNTSNEGKTGIDFLYTQVLEQAFRDAEMDAQELYSRFKLIVGAVLLVFYPLSRKTLSELLKNFGAQSRISNTLRSLHSLLLVPTDEVDPIRTFHKSFPDFLTDPRRCKDERFFVDPPTYHTNLLFSCLELMKRKLRRNVCNLDECPTLEEVKDLPARREAHIGSALEYACRFWTRHLAEVSGSGPHVKQVQDLVDEFFTIYLLFWIEVLGLTGNLNFGIYALHEIDQWYLSVSHAGYLSNHTFMCPQTGGSCKWTSDSQRFILLNFDEICRSPSSVYGHLPFCPSSSWFHQWYTAESLQGVRMIGGCPEKWETHSRVVSFEHTPEALAYWKDIVAVGLSSGEIMVLDVVTGSRKSVLSEHKDSVKSLSFSSDGTLLVSGGRDKAIKLWDIQTGGVMKTFNSTHRVSAVSISPDAVTIASGSQDNEIHLWDIRTGNGHRIAKIAPESRPVTSVDFLPTVPGRLISLSASGFVQQWDINGSRIGPRLSGHNVAFSSDGRHFVLCDKEAPTVRDFGSGKTTAILRSPGRNFSCCCFSPNGEFVAAASESTVFVWSIAGIHSTPRLIGSFIPLGTTSKITSLLYSSSLISAHSDKKIIFCQVDGDSQDSTATNVKSTLPVAPDDVTCIDLQAKENFAITVDFSGAVKLWDLSTGLPKTLLEASLPESCARSARLLNGKLIICSRSSGGNWEISTWDVGTGECLQRTTLSGVPSIRKDDPFISEDGTILFFADSQGIQTWCTLTGQAIGSTSIGLDPEQCPSYQAILDGSTVWVRSGLSSVEGWDVANLQSPPLDSYDIPGKTRLALIENRKILWDEGRGTMVERYDLMRIEDIASGMVVLRPPTRLAQPIKARWDGRYLVAAYLTGEVLILDFVHMIPQ